METITVLGGEIRVERKQFGVEYTVDVLRHPYFGNIKIEDRLLLLDNKRRRSGTNITWGGCSAWTPEQFLSVVANQNGLADALSGCLVENNFISRALGVRDFDAAKKRLAVLRQKRLQRVMANLTGADRRDSRIAVATKHGWDVIQWSVDGGTAQMVRNDKDGNMVAIEIGTIGARRFGYPHTAIWK